MAVNLEALTVEVGRVNGHGFQDEQGNWLNVSKFATPADVTLPTVGERVTVYLDSKGFVRRIEQAASLESWINR